MTYWSGCCFGLGPIWFVLFSARSDPRSWAVDLVFTADMSEAGQMDQNQSVTTESEYVQYCSSVGCSWPAGRTWWSGTVSTGWRCGFLLQWRTACVDINNVLKTGSRTLLWRVYVASGLLSRRQSGLAAAVGTHHRRIVERPDLWGQEITTLETWEDLPCKAGTTALPAIKTTLHTYCSGSRYHLANVTIDFAQKFLSPFP